MTYEEALRTPGYYRLGEYLRTMPDGTRQIGFGYWSFKTVPPRYIAPKPATCALRADP